MKYLNVLKTNKFVKRKIYSSLYFKKVTGAENPTSAGNVLGYLSKSIEIKIPGKQFFIGS